MRTGPRWWCTRGSTRSRRGDRDASSRGGGVIHAETAKRLACHGRVQVVIEDAAGHPVRLGRMSREPSAWMMRQLRYRDSECRFPGCGARRFTQAHHIVWWEHGGRTDLDNLLLVCTFHHKLCTSTAGP
ncbi:MAG: HNH endonuclease [Actinomycetota bacterium]